MSRWMTLLGAVLLGGVLVGCGANGGDPVARRQIPAADGGSAGSASAAGSGDSGSSGSDPAGSGGSGSGSGSLSGSGSGGGASGQGSGDDDARTVGLPKSIRIPEIGQEAFEQAVVTACGSRNGAPGCLTVTSRTNPTPRTAAPSSSCPTRRGSPLRLIRTILTTCRP